MCILFNLKIIFQTEILSTIDRNFKVSLIKSNKYTKENGQFLNLYRKDKKNLKAFILKNN